MAANWENVGIIMICINIFIYIGSASAGLELVQGDPLSALFISDFNQSQLLDDASNSNLRVNNSIIKEPEQITAQKGGILSNVLLLLDPLEIVFDFIAIVFNFLFAPLILFKIQGIPYIVAFMIAVPMVIGFWFSLFRLVRGA